MRYKVLVMANIDGPCNGHLNRDLRMLLSVVPDVYAVLIPFQR